MEPFTKYYDFLKDYCKESPLNYDKIISYGKCGNKKKEKEDCWMKHLQEFF